MALDIEKPAQAAQDQSLVEEVKEEVSPSPQRQEEQSRRLAWLQVSAAFALYWNSL